MFYLSANLSQEESKPLENKTEEIQEVAKPSNTGFDLDDLFRMDWIPGLLQVTFCFVLFLMFYNSYCFCIFIFSYMYIYLCVLCCYSKSSSSLIFSKPFFFLFRMNLLQIIWEMILGVVALVNGLNVIVHSQNPQITADVLLFMKN